MSGNRGNLYRTIASIAGTLLGFSLAAVSLILSFSSSPRLALLQGSSHYPVLWKTFIQATKCLGALTITSLICLAVDKDNYPIVWLVVPLCLFLGLSTVRLIRVIWILEEFFNIVSIPRT